MDGLAGLHQRFPVKAETKKRLIRPYSRGLIKACIVSPTLQRNSNKNGLILTSNPKHVECHAMSPERG